MKCAKLLSITGLLLTCSPLFADNFIPTVAEKSIGKASINYKVSGKGTTFLNSDRVEVTFDLDIANEDIGFNSGLYLVAEANNQRYMRNQQNKWTLWTDNSLIPAKTVTLEKQEQLEIRQTDLPVGEYTVYAAYKTRNGDLKYNEAPATLIVFDKKSASLHKVNNPEVLRDYLYQGAIHNPPILMRTTSVLENVATQADSGNDSVSSTNLQEKGVDEADRMKTDQGSLFSLIQCDKQQCLNRYELTDNPAQSNLLESLVVSDESNQHTLGAMYLNKATDKTTRSIIWLNSRSKVQSILESTQVRGGNNKPQWQPEQSEIQLKFINASKAEALSIKQQLTIEGELISSRLVGDVLYILSRKSTQYPSFFDDKSKPIKPPLDFFLPHYTFNKEKPKAFNTSTERCYIPPKDHKKANKGILSVVTAIPVQNPKQYKSVCIAGELDTFYASTASLYFASSRYTYSAQGNKLIYNAPQAMLTDIHKFSLNSVNMEYRGSGKVDGHLGWHKDKKSFRLGEYKDYLRIATSTGHSWDRSSRTKLTVLKEDTKTKTLTQISVLDNLGKPGEKLYAARFVGKRGYLVTFRVTDPLIVIDFSEAEAPTVLGELEISGYSDYLQAVGDNYLLGIGKEAVADEGQNSRIASSQSLPSRGAWYQGVKVALFDVSSAEKLGEIKSLVFGKRGSTATVLSDHHGLAWVKTNENHYTLALPIKLHKTQPTRSRKEKEAPWTYYDWTHTGVYVFDVNTLAPALTLTGKLIAEVNDGSASHKENQEILNDRTVIQNQTIHYIHGDKVISAPIKDLK